MKLKSSWLQKKKEKEIACEIYGKNKSSTHEIVKREKEIHASFDVTPQTERVAATVCGKYLVKME